MFARPAAKAQSGNESRAHARVRRLANPVNARGSRAAAILAQRAQDSGEHRESTAADPRSDRDLTDSAAAPRPVPAHVFSYPALPFTRTAPVVARQPATEPGPVNPQTAPAEREREVEAIKVGGMSYVLYQTKVRGGGSSSWLANNPGNMDYTADTVAWGCYEGKSLPWGQHRFAIFQDESVGLGAVRKFLRKYQTTRDITLMMNLFAPAGDLENDPTKYSKRVADRIGPPVTVHTLVKDLTDAQIEIFADQIKRTEGWVAGPVNDVPRGDPSLPEGVRER